jgi:phosphoribosylanthranilate isomerase
MKIKICGLTTLEDALAAAEAGADLLGFNFYPPSPRFISIETCARLVSALKERGYAGPLVGVFVNAAPEQIAAVLDTCRLDLAQLHGDEPPEALARLGARAFKALRPSSPEDLQESLRRYAPYPASPAWLVDSYRLGEYGGTGQTADWSMARRLAEQAPILLAGGLRPENVTEAIRQVQPWGVDVASGVESAPGRKDAHKMRALVQAVREMEAAEKHL